MQIDEDDVRIVETSLTGKIVEVTMHPLVLLSAADHYHRVARGTRKRVVGVLLGSVSKGVVDCTNSFAVPFEEDSKNAVSFAYGFVALDGVDELFDSDLNGRYWNDIDGDNSKIQDIKRLFSNSISYPCPPFFSTNFSVRLLLRSQLLGKYAYNVSQSERQGTSRWLLFHWSTNSTE